MYSIALTGGRTAKEIYKIWSCCSKFKKLSNIDYFLTDERCVSIENSLSNAGMVMDTLFSNGIPAHCNFYAPIKSEIDISGQVQRYESIIPRKIDIVLLTVGDDGHIASIFPKTEATLENRKYFIETTSPVMPKKRVTLTYPAILNAKKIYILGVTEAKKKLLESVKNNKYKFCNLPVKKVIHAHHIVEQDIEKAASILLDSMMLEINGYKLL
jgi:6-phosphogluconolactonase